MKVYHSTSTFLQTHFATVPPHRTQHFNNMMISVAKLAALVESMNAGIQAGEELLGRSQISTPNQQLAIEPKISSANEPSGN